MALRKLMQNLPNTVSFYLIYHRWVANVLAIHYASKISYSGHPKMRVHLSGTEGVSAFHRDVDITGRFGQINCYLPFTDVYDGSTIFVETDYGNNQFREINLVYGQALIWDGGLLKHGTRNNNTNNTRVSCDFRFEPKMLDLVKSPWRDVLADRPQTTM